MPLFFSYFRKFHSTVSFIYFLPTESLTLRLERISLSERQTSAALFGLDHSFHTYVSYENEEMNTPKRELGREWCINNHAHILGLLNLRV
jgi:hypothetical protein